MKFLISYFYQVRNMKSNMIPISTARSDPKWFHKNQGNSYIYLDKNNVINGLRATFFAPNDECSQYCGQCDNRQQPCIFLNKYKKQLEQLDFNTLIKQFESLLERLKPVVDFAGEEPVFVLLVHEAPNNPCSERGKLIEYFHENGIELKEFDKNE